MSSYTKYLNYLKKKELKENRSTYIGLSILWAFMAILILFAAITGLVRLNTLKDDEDLNLINTIICYISIGIIFFWSFVSAAIMGYELRHVEEINEQLKQIEEDEMLEDYEQKENT